MQSCIYGNKHVYEILLFYNLQLHTKLHGKIRQCIQVYFVYIYNIINYLMGNILQHHGWLVLRFRSVFQVLIAKTSLWGIEKFFSFLLFSRFLLHLNEFSVHPNKFPFFLPDSLHTGSTCKNFESKFQSLVLLGHLQYRSSINYISLICKESSL